MRSLSLLLLLLFCSGLRAQEPFLVAPYLQSGPVPPKAAWNHLELLWHAEDQEAAWAVEVNTGKAWVRQARPTQRRLDAPPLAPHRIYRATLAGLRAGGQTSYRVTRNGQVVFKGVARVPGGQRVRVAVFGDAANGSPEQGAIARAVQVADPDLVFMTGDLVYGRGRAEEYRQRFFPVYNGASTPLMRSVPFLGVVGNHDVPFRKFPDASAFFAYWSLPLNGPPLKPGDPGAAPLVAGVHDAVAAAAGPAYPRMGSYSFDVGPTHWTVLDSNAYADWDLPRLKAWLEADLKAARRSAWRIVALHHPLFQSAVSHAEDQWMRPISPILERYGVSLVLAGHVHNYQRTAPLRFQPDPGQVRGGPVKGTFAVDEAFNGSTATRPKGIIHIVTGAGGAELYDPWQTDARSSWQPWTRAFVSDRHSFTVLEVDARTLRLRQLDAQGAELDAVTLTR